MKTLHIIVADKVATYLQRDGYIVCGNSDYQIEFTFDDEWAAYSQKTARFIWNGKYVDVTFSGTVCPVPIVANTDRLEVGVYAKDLCTTTSAVITCRRSIRCNSNVECEGTVVIPEGAGEVKLQEKTAVKNGEVIADEGYDGLSKVTVNVPGGNEWRGVYEDGTVYKVNEYVDYDGNVYICIEDTDGTQNPTNTEYWARVNKLPNTYGIEVTPTKDIQNIVPEGDFDGFDEVIVNPIPDEYIDTSDATATADKILLNETAYVNGEKVTGSIETYEGVNSTPVAHNMVGTWKFTADPHITSTITDAFSFISDGKSFNVIELLFDSSDGSGHLSYLGSTNHIVYDDNHTYGSNWRDVGLVDDGKYESKYQTIEILTAPTNEEFIAWLKANAIKDGYDDYLEISETSPNGVLLDAESKYVNKPIRVVPILQKKTATANGDVVADDGYTGLSKVAVHLPLISKTITKNGTYKASEEVDIIGTWFFNETIIPPSSPITVNGSYSSYDDTLKAYEGVKFTFGQFTTGTKAVYIRYDSHYAYSTAYDGWYNELCRTITITEITSITDDFDLLSWLNANATKIAVAGYSEVIVNVAGGDVEEVEEWDGSGVVIEEIATEDELAGTWTMFEMCQSFGGYYDVHFTSNNNYYIAMFGEHDNIDRHSLSYEDENGTLTKVCGGEYGAFQGWTNDAYRTITITSKLSEVTNGSTLLAWLKANASKQ